MTETTFVGLFCSFLLQFPGKQHANTQTCVEGKVEDFFFSSLTGDHADSKVRTSTSTHPLSNRLCTPQTSTPLKYSIIIIQFRTNATYFTADDDNINILCNIVQYSLTIIV